MFISNASVHCAVENKYSLFTLYVVVASCRGGTDDKVITKSGGMFGKHWPFKAAYEDQKLAGFDRRRGSFDEW